MGKHNLEILEGCSQRESTHQLCPGREIGWCSFFSHMMCHENWGLNSKAQRCFYGSCEKLQLQGQAICWDAG